LHVCPVKVDDVNVDGTNAAARLKAESKLCGILARGSEILILNIGEARSLIRR